MIENGFFFVTHRCFAQRRRRRREIFPDRDVVSFAFPKHRKEQRITAHDLANQVLAFDFHVRESQVTSVFTAARKDPSITELSTFNRNGHSRQVVLFASVLVFVVSKRKHWQQTLDAPGSAQ
jgi:hypothetical protein